MPSPHAPPEETRARWDLAAAAFALGSSLGLIEVAIRIVSGRVASPRVAVWMVPDAALGYGVTAALGWLSWRSVARRLSLPQSMAEALAGGAGLLGALVAMSYLSPSLESLPAAFAIGVAFGWAVRKLPGLGGVSRRAGLQASGLAVGVLAISVLWLAAHAGRAPVAVVATGPNVVLVTIDTLRADHVGAYGAASGATPNIDRIAAEGALFLDAVTTTTHTGPSHLSILTGLHPFHHGARKNGQRLSPSVSTIADVLAAAGYVTGAFVSGYPLKDRSCGLASRFQVYDEDFGRSRFLPEAISNLRVFRALHGRGLLGLPTPRALRHGAVSQTERTGDETTSEAARWLRGTGQRPFFLWVHYYDPHMPYLPPPSQLPPDGAQASGELEARDTARHWYDMSPREKDQVIETRALVDGMKTLYAAEISFVDEQIGLLMNVLEERGVDADTLLVVTADHGEGLGEHGLYFEHNDLYETDLHVPLVLRFPRRDRRWAGQRVSAQTRLTDLAPTILDYLGRESPAPMDGASVLPLLASGDTVQNGRPIVSYAPDGPMTQLAARDHGLKLMWSSGFWIGGRRLSPKEELYDLRADPEERTNRIDDLDGRAAAVDALHGMLEEWRALSAAQPTAKVGGEVLERLRSLGYLR